MSEGQVLGVVEELGIDVVYDPLAYGRTYFLNRRMFGDLRRLPPVPDEREPRHPVEDTEP